MLRCYKEVNLNLVDCVYWASCIGKGLLPTGLPRLVSRVTPQAPLLSYILPLLLLLPFSLLQPPPTHTAHTKPGSLPAGLLLSTPDISRFTGLGESHSQTVFSSSLKPHLSCYLYTFYCSVGLTWRKKWQIRRHLKELLDLKKISKN